MTQKTIVYFIVLIVLGFVCIISPSYAQDQEHNKENKITPEEETQRLLKERVKLLEEYLETIRQFRQDFEKTKREISELRNHLQAQEAEINTVESCLEDVFKSKIEGIEKFEIPMSFPIQSWVEADFFLANEPHLVPHELPWGTEKTCWDLQMTFVDSKEIMHEGTCRIDISEKKDSLSHLDLVEGYKFSYTASFNNCNFDNTSLAENLNLLSVEWVSKSKI